MATARKRRLVVWFETYPQNPPVTLALLAGLPLPPLALLETTGHRSGWPTPSGRCTERTRPWRVCSAPTWSPSASTLTMSQANRAGDQRSN